MHDQQNAAFIEEYALEPRTNTDLRDYADFPVDIGGTVRIWTTLNPARTVCHVSMVDEDFNTPPYNFNIEGENLNHVNCAGLANDQMLNGTGVVGLPTRNLLA